MAQLNQAVLDEVVRRVVKVAQPEKIILFGSAVSENMSPNSDIDIMVVKSGVHRRHLAQAIYMNFFGLGQSVDVIVATPEDIERYRNSIGLIVESALKTGRVIYERETFAA